jgi:hypothetical protein
MADYIGSLGTVETSVPATQKVGIFSRTPAKLYKKLVTAKFPASWVLVATTTAGSEYTSAALDANVATDIRIEASEAEVFYEVGAAPSVFEPLADQTFADATGLISGLAAAQGGSATFKGGTSSTAGNAGGAAILQGGTPGSAGVGGKARVLAGAGGSASGSGGDAELTAGAGTAGNANGGCVVITAGAKNGTGKNGCIRQVSFGAFPQPNPTAKTTAVTLTIAELMTGIITGTHAAGATQAYTLPTGANCDLTLQFANDDSFDWSLLNLSAAAIDTITLTASTTHTIVGNPIVQSSHVTTGGIYGNSAMFRTRKTAADTYVTYRIA